MELLAAFKYGSLLILIRMAFDISNLFHSALANKYNTFSEWFTSIPKQSAVCYSIMLDSIMCKVEYYINTMYMLCNNMITKRRDRNSNAIFNEVVASCDTNADAMMEQRYKQMKQNFIRILFDDESDDGASKKRQLAAMSYYIEGV